MGPPGSTGARGEQGPQGTAGPQGPAGGLFGEDAAVFAGFTTTPITGTLGREAMHARCAAAFTGAHLCHLAEYELSTSTTPVPAAGAWVDPSGESDGETDGYSVSPVASTSSGRLAYRALYLNCSSWSDSTASGLALTPAGTNFVDCNTTRVLACCSSPYREKFRGFTSTTVTGAAGGRAQMHARCAAAFTGSHVCHVAEYQRAASTVTPPAGGAWIDGSVIPRNSDSTEAQFATRDAGRLIGRSIYDNCENWTNATAGEAGLSLEPTLITSRSCATARPLACCE